VSEYDDTDAIGRCQRGESGGLTTLVMRYERDALRLAYLLTNDRFLAEDIAQESFLQAYQAIDRFHIGKPFKPWLLRIVANQARMRQRSLRRKPEVSLDSLLDAQESEPAKHEWGQLRPVTPDLVGQVESLEERLALAQALARLTQKQRAAVVLRYYFELSDQEIARILDCRVDTARHRISDGLRALERMIRRYYPSLLHAQPHETSTPLHEQEAQRGAS